MCIRDSFRGKNRGGGFKSKAAAYPRDLCFTFARLIVARGRTELPSLAGQPAAPRQPAPRLPGQRLVIERE
eukprot:12327349-Alexandrium_andersonii.AAC.1